MEGHRPFSVARALICRTREIASFPLWKNCHPARVQLRSCLPARRSVWLLGTVALWYGTYLSPFCFVWPHIFYTVNVPLGRCINKYSKGSLHRTLSKCLMTATSKRELWATVLRPPSQLVHTCHSPARGRMAFLLSTARTSREGPGLPATSRQTAFPPRSGPPLCVTRLIGIRDRSLSPYRLELGTQMTSSQKTKKIYHHHQAVRHGNIRRPHYSFSKATSTVPTSTH